MRISERGIVGDAVDTLELVGYGGSKADLAAIIGVCRAARLQGFDGRFCDVGGRREIGLASH